VVVRAEIKKAAARRETTVAALDRPKVALEQLKRAEKEVISALMCKPEAGVAALALLEPEDLVGLPTRAILEQARSLQEMPLALLPATLIERLNEEEARLVQEIVRKPPPPGDPLLLARALKRLRYDRERADIQREISRLQEAGAADNDAEINRLWERKRALVHLIADS
jgi:hypothetical protein